MPGPSVHIDRVRPPAILGIQPPIPPRLTDNRVNCGGVTHVEFDLDFKIGQPIRQGDLFGFWDWRTRTPLARFGAIITADCDIENGRPDQELVYLRIITHSDYIDVFWSRFKLAIARKKALDDLVGQVNRLRRERDHDSSDLTPGEIEQWIASEISNDIADTIGVADAREKLKLIRNLEQTRNVMRLASAPLGSSCLNHLVELRSQGRSNVLKQAANDLKSERDDVFFLTSLTDRDDSSGYYILLDHIGALPRDQLSDSLDEVSRGAKAAYRFGTLATTYKYAVAQRFAFLFQKIGLPNDHKKRHEAALTGINSVEGNA
jgi:hypothetical protein